MELQRAYIYYRRTKPAKAALEAARLAISSTAQKSLYFDAGCACVQWDKNEKGLARIESPESFGLRFVGRVVPECRRSWGPWDDRGDCGWHTDPHGAVYRGGTGLCHGVVYQLAGRDGCARFVAGYEFGGMGGGLSLDFSTFYTSGRSDYPSSARDNDTAFDAACAADNMARIAAEKEREYQTAYWLGQVYAGACEDVAAARREALETIAQFKAARRALDTGAPMPGNPDGDTVESRYERLCSLIRSDISDFLDQINEAREIMRKALSGESGDFYVYMDDTAKAAFCEAAELDSFPA